MDSEHIDAVLLAEWILKSAAGQNCFMTNSKLQILLYYSQAWYLAFYRRILFDASVEAWIHGPAVYSVYKHFETRSFLCLHIRKSLPEIPGRVKLHLNEVLEVFLPFQTGNLEEMVKNEQAWQNARKGLSPCDSSRTIISLEEIQRFYSKK